MKIYDKKHYHRTNYNYDNLLSSEILAELENIEVGKTIVINNKRYCISVIIPSKKIAFVKEYTLKDKVETTYNDDNFECPYCGQEISDSREYHESEEVEINCDTCGNTFYAVIETSVTYKTLPKD